MKDEPLISCLCVTRGRVELLKRAVRAFENQSYQNKELVIVYESDDQASDEFVTGITETNVLKMKAPSTPRLTLGELRNMAVRVSNGDYFCQWDDDDYYHNERLSFQFKVLRDSAMPACVLIYWIMFDEVRREAYISHMRPWEGSILCKKSVIGDDVRYKNMSRGEDTPLIQELFSRNMVFPVVMPKLYIYVYHGGNVWTEKHWRKIFNLSKKLSAGSSEIIGGILDGKYTADEASRLLDSIEE